MNRRNFLSRTGAEYARLALPRPARLFATPAAPDGWRRFEVMTRVVVLKPAVTTDGMVKAKADAITRGALTDLERARAIYEWIVDNTFRKPTTRGCGLGDIRFMLETGDLGGKCADLNALFVGLARASGLPARDVYGIRVAKSELGYRSLGASSEHVTKAQHCRARPTNRALRSAHLPP